MRIFSSPGAFFSLLFLGWGLSGCSGEQSVLNPVGPLATDVTNLAWLLMAVAAIVFAVVIGGVLLAVLRARRADRHSGHAIHQPSASHERRTVQLVVISGAIVPAIVLIILMGLAIVIERGGVVSASQDMLTVQVIGHRWWWEIRYPDHDVITANEIHIPTGEPVIFRLTSNDVIHSFWAPQLGGKMDLIPGQTNTIQLQADTPGVYRGQCGEFCGLQHANMAFLVIATERDDFDTWLEHQGQAAPEPQTDLIEAGRQAFMGSACVYCHRIEGTNASGVIGPDLTHLASRQTLGAGTIPNTPGNLAGWIANPQTIKPGNLMPPMSLESDQLQAILAYLATLE